MKRIYLVMIAMLMAVASYAQDTTWHFGGFAQFNLNQVALVNWAAGGSNSVSASIIGNAYANYAWNRHSWQNTFDGSWGLIRTEGQVRKNEDRMELNSLYGYNFKKHWFASGLMNFKSQFTHGFDFPDDTTSLRVSKFAAPAFMVLSAGFTYKPNDIFQLYMSPATGKFTFVRSDALIPETRYGLDSAAIVRAEFGAYLTATVQYEIFKNVNLWSKLDLFNNYTDPVQENRKQVDVDWQVRIDFKVNKYISTSLQTQLLYDWNIDVPIDTNGDGNLDGTGKRVQFREALAIAFSYKFHTNNGKK